MENNVKSNLLLPPRPVQLLLSCTDHLALSSFVTEAKQKTQLAESLDN